MLQFMTFRRAATVALLALAGCGGGDRESDRAVEGLPGDAPAAQAIPAPRPQPQAPPPISLEVNLAEREIYVIRNGERVATHSVAVGSDEWPTPTGEWSVAQVIWNPRWIPPAEEWAEDEEGNEPGDPDNPLGRAQLVYAAPNSVHGTNDPSSLGKAVSHGSIRVSNEVATDLARQVMEAGGAGRDEAWYQAAMDNPTERHDVSIPNPIPIRVVAGDG